MYQVLVEELDELVYGAARVFAFDDERCWSEPVDHFGLVEHVDSMPLGFAFFERLEDVDLVCVSAQLESCNADVKNPEYGLRADGIFDHQVGEVEDGNVIHDLDVFSLCCFDRSLEFFLLSAPGVRWLRLMFMVLVSSRTASGPVVRISFQRRSSSCSVRV